MKVKICGLTREEDALFAAECGADFLGFIFVEDSPRFVDAGHVATGANAVRARPTPPQLVGVFRNASHERMRDVAARATLDLVQLHGSEDNDDIHTLGFPAIK